MKTLPVEQLRKYKSSINKIANFELLDNCYIPLTKKECFRIAKKRNKNYRTVLKQIRDAK